MANALEIVCPPDSVMRKSMGVADSQLYIKSGTQSLHELEQWLAGVGRGLTDGMKFIDVGSGSGRLAQPLLAKYPELNYLGVDIDEESIAFCESIGIPSARFSLVNAEKNGDP